MKERSELESELVWSVCPFRRERAKGVVSLAMAGGTVWAAWTFGGALLALVGFLVLTGGIGPFFVCTRYRLSPDEVEVRSLFRRTRRGWGDFRSAYAGKRAVTLSPFRGRHLLEPYRSVMLRYDGHRREILERVRAFGPELPKARER